MTYDAFFTHATRRPPFPYQRDLALADRFPEALCAPTGSGKTAAVVLAWLYRRRLASEVQRRATPRRLVVCLPMRALVTQTVSAVSDRLRRLELLEHPGHRVSRVREALPREASDAAVVDYAFITP